ncbi:MAG: uracil-DNA glycosylase [Gammaproteobacteria bacterium]
MSEAAHMHNRLGRLGLKTAYLQAMDIQPWVARDDSASAVVADASPVAVRGAELPDWAELEARVAHCTLCSLHETRTQTVFGTGNRQADWLIIGEAPGADEDRQGEPFVGRAGLLLNEMLRATGYRREEVYIANILKCRPPNNRNPRPDEVQCCHGYLQQQIDLLQPRIILAVGGIAAHNLLGTDMPVGKLRGTLHHCGDSRIPLVVTYHPAYLLRSPLEKRKVWADLQFARQVFQSAGQEIS